VPGLDSEFLRPLDPAARTAGWQSAALEAETPFLGPLEMPTEEAEAETGGATADAFVHDADGRAYFTTFPRLGDLTVRKATILSPRTFENLIDHMLASDSKNFVVDAHGDPDGLHMHLGRGTAVSATGTALFMLDGIEHIRTMMRLAEDNTSIWARASDAELDSWRRIVDAMHTKQWRRIKGWPQQAPRVDTVAAARSLITARLGAVADGLFPGGPRSRVDALVRKMTRLRAKGLREIQFRACNIGQRDGTLRDFRRFFGADHLCAPKVRSGFGTSSLTVSAHTAEALARRSLAQVYDMPGGRFVIVVKVDGHRFTATSAADTAAAASEWVAAHLMAKSRYRRGAFPIHFLEATPAAFALDPEYAAQVRCSTSFWESAVRGVAFETPIPEIPVSAFEEEQEEEHEEEQPEWAMEWADAPESEDEVPVEHDTPPMTPDIADAADKKDWPRLLDLAIRTGWHDEHKLTNLLFFGRYPELDRRKLDPARNAGDRALAEEWKRILRTEVRPVIQKVSEDSTLAVRGHFVAERDPDFAGEPGERFIKLVDWAAAEVRLDPGFLAAVLLAEVGSAAPYLSSAKITSFRTGTDDLFDQRAQLWDNVVAFTKVRFDAQTTTNINEHGRTVRTVNFRSGKDAVLATGVYLAWARIKLGRAMSRAGGNFDDLPAPTRFLLMRVAMAAGHGGIGLDGSLIRFKTKNGKRVPVRPGEAGGVLLGVARTVERVLAGEDVLVRNWEPRKNPTDDSRITHRNATILAAQALHLGDWFFRTPPSGVQPEIEEA
jgi:hypothetical protein